MAEEKKYYIRVPEALVEVSEDVYLTYFRMRRRWYAQGERDKNNGLVSYNAMDTEELLGEEMICDHSSPSVEDAATDRVLRAKLRHCIALLTDEEQSLVQAIFYEEKTEREYAKILGISQKAVNKRRHKVLAKLYKLIRT